MSGFVAIDENSGVFLLVGGGTPPLHGECVICVVCENGGRTLCAPTIVSLFFSRWAVFYSQKSIDRTAEILYNNYVVFICIILLWQYMQLCFKSLSAKDDIYTVPAALNMINKTNLDGDHNVRLFFAGRILWGIGS